VGRKPFKAPEEKLAVVLSVLRGETTQIAIARKMEMSQTTIAKWQKQFLEGGLAALAKGDNAQSPPHKRESELEAQVGRPIRMQVEALYGVDQYDVVLV